MQRHIVATIVAVCLAGPVAAAAAPTNVELLDAISKEVVSYAWFTVFDDVNASVEEGIVRLTGKVTLPFKRNDIARRVGRLDGVLEVENDIAVLPASQLDDRLRAQVATALFNHPALRTYAIQVEPTIHIVVEHGHVTLTGTVNSAADRAIAESVASQALAFSVTNALRTTREVTLARAAA